MQRTALRRAGLVVAPLLLAAAGAVATATPAAADCTNVVTCSASNSGGSLHAGVSYITVSVKGGHYASRAATVEVPNQVPPPCWYNKGRSGAEMYADSKDPYYYGLANHVGEEHDDWFPPIVDEHKDDDGNFYSWECSSGNFDGSIEDFFKYVDEWSAQNPALIWVPAGQAPPQPPVPPEILMAIATDAMDKAVRMPTVNFNPAARSFVRLDTWMWFDRAAWDPIVVTAAGGGNQVTLTATPKAVGVSGVPAGSEVRTGCAGGGRAYAAGGSTDCMINFARSSGGQPGQQWHFQVNLTWGVVAEGAALQGPPTITRTEDEALTVLEAQSVAGPPPTAHN
jgi:hypothetical protein